jgi:hypothetical protein
MMTTDWTSIRSCFPISQQPEADDAARLLLAIAPTDPDDYWRAQAWFAYLAATAVLDWWDYRNSSWGAWQTKPRQVFWRDAKELANEAVRNMPRTSNSGLYDALWARGFILAADGDLIGAIADYYDAISVGGAKKDANILAEAADAAVYAGDIGRAREWINSAFAELAGMNPPKTPPKWFHWVRAWVTVGEGAIGRDPQKGVDAINDLDAVYNNPVPQDFDVAIVRLLALYLSDPNDKQSREQLWSDYRSKVKNRKGMDWNLQLELARSPFNLHNATAASLFDMLKQAIPK